MYEKFIDKAISNPEWELIRQELCGPEPEDPTIVYMGGGASIWFGAPDKRSKADKAKDNLWSELCWWINHGPGYCAKAPEAVKVYLRRLNLI